MDNETIKILRSKISIPLNEAIELLKRNNGDILLSEKDFHNKNIFEICKKTECDEETAIKEYQICNYDLTKVIERINKKLIVIGTGNNLDSKIGFILWPENKRGEFYKTEKRNDIFIVAEDFDIVLDVFESFFSLQNPANNAIEDEFDVIGHNYFENKISRLIVEKISLLKTDDKREGAFLQELVNWFNDKLAYADYIVVYGNL